MHNGTAMTRNKTACGGPTNAATPSGFGVWFGSASVVHRQWLESAAFWCILCRFLPYEGSDPQYVCFSYNEYSDCASTNTDVGTPTFDIKGESMNSFSSFFPLAGSIVNRVNGQADIFRYTYTTKYSHYAVSKPQRAIYACSNLSIL
jgi:hypothetical protein